MITLENEDLTVIINKFGAELSSIVDQKTSYEYMWQADEKYWGRHAPVLFPIVGRLKNNQYKYQGKTYEMTQHGFARDSMFDVVEQTESFALFKLKSTEKTKQNYPFDFELYIQYTLLRNNVITKYKVTNLSETEPMYYAIGGHPAFNVSQKENEKGQLEFDQVSVQIKPNSELISYPLSKDGLIKEKEAAKVNPKEIVLSHEIFKGDALVYKTGQWDAIELKDNANKVKISMQTSNLTYLGIWSPYPKRAPFVCIEPWAGIADAENTEGNFEDKMGMNILEPSKTLTHEYTVSFEKM